MIWSARTWSVGLPLAIALLVAPALAVPTGRPIRVLSLLGEGQVNGDSLSAPGEWPAGSELELKRSSIAQVMLPGLSLSVVGPARLRLLGQSAEVELWRGELVRLSGQGLILASGWELRLEGQGATVLLDGARCYALEGRVRIGARAEAVGPVQRLLRQLSGAPTRWLTGMATGPRVARGSMESGQSARFLLSGGVEIMIATPPPERLALTRRFAVPDRWEPPLTPVSPASIRRATRLVREQRQAQREGASCGCTESRGPGAPPLSGANPTTALERNRGTVRVQVTGVPRINP